MRTRSPMWKIGVAIFVGLMCGVHPQIVQASPTITFDQPVHFLASGDENVVVQPGTYEVLPGEKSLTLKHSDAQDSSEIVVSANMGKHAERIESPLVSIIPGKDEDVIHLLMFLEDKTIMEAIGSYSGVRTRIIGLIDAIFGSPAPSGPTRQEALTSVTRMSNAGWRSLGAATNVAGVVSKPSCVSKGLNRLDCMVITTAGGISQKSWYRGDVSADWGNVGGNPSGGPRCILFGTWAVGCFIKDLGNNLSHRFGTFVNVGPGIIGWGGRWSNLGTPSARVRTAKDTTCITRVGFNVDCMAIDVDGRLQHKWLDGGRWRGWVSRGTMGVPMVGPVSCVSTAPTRMDCFGRSKTDSHIYQRSWIKGRWYNWTDHNFGGSKFTFNGNPSCTKRGTNLIDCVARGRGNNHVYYKHYNGSRWSTWADFGGSAKSDPMCSSSRSNRIDCFYFSFSNKVNYKTKIGTQGWSKWKEMPQAGSSVNTFLGCTIWRWQYHKDASTTDRFDCFAKGSNGVTYQRMWF